MNMPILRPIAKAFKFNDFTDQGKEAFKMVAKALDESVQAIDKPSSQSQLLFLSGSRGTGKTSLLLSLKNVLSEQTDPHDDNEKDFGIPREKQYQLAQKIIWLEELESESLPDSSNLLASILVRLEKAIEESMNNRKLSQTRFCDPQHAGSDKDPIFQLQRLQSDVALAWQGNMPGRGVNLDPETLSIEVLQAERARMRINERLSDVLNNLSLIDDKFKKSLFVLPIDDFDQNPSRCLEILRLIRMITLPRLFFIILGDINILQNIVKLSISAELTNISGYANSNQMFHQYSNEIYSDAAGISIDSVNKLIPYNQIIHLAPMDHESALKKQLFGEFESLDKILKKIKIDSNKNLFNFFHHIPEQSYTGLFIFNAPIRRVLDLWVAFSKISKEKAKEQKDKLIDFVGDFFCQAIMREPRLSIDNKNVLLKSFYKNQPGKWFIKSPLFYLKLKDYKEEILYKENNSQIIMKRPYTHLLSIKYIEDDNTNANQTKDLWISLETMGWITLLNDINVKLTPNYKYEPIVNMDIIDDTFGLQTQWVIGSNEYTIGWPKPDVFSLQSIEYLIHLFQKNSENENSLKRFVYIWLNFLVNPFLDVQISQSDIKNFKGSFSEEKLKDKLDDIIVLLSPEMGLPIKFWDKIFDLIGIKVIDKIIDEHIIDQITEKRIKNIVKIPDDYHKNYGVIDDSYITDFESCYQNISSYDNAPEFIEIMDFLKDNFFSMNEESIEKNLTALYNIRGQLRDGAEVDPEHPVAKLIELLEHLTKDKSELEARQHPVNNFRDGLFRPRSSEIDQYKLI